ncbi:MAG: DUF429 domain-containing protein [Desulfurococcales archaeon]|nr:DUF429 domain-containing protein [Desulfurococcales archaeon]
MSSKCFIGIDLSGQPSRFTGIAITNEKGKLVHLSLSLGQVSSLFGIVHSICANDGVVAVDSPLNVPSGKKGFREIDRKLLRLGFKVLPLGSWGMQLLVRRAEQLSILLRREGFEVIETHPRSSIILAGCNYEDWYRCVSRYIFLPKWILKLDNRDAIDAIISATVAFLHGKEPSLDFELHASDGDIHLLPPGN